MRFVEVGPLRVAILVVNIGILISFGFLANQYLFGEFQPHLGSAQDSSVYKITEDSLSTTNPEFQSMVSILRKKKPPEEKEASTAPPPPPPKPMGPLKDFRIENVFVLEGRYAAVLKDGDEPAAAEKRPSRGSGRGSRGSSRNSGRSSRGKRSADPLSNRIPIMAIAGENLYNFDVRVDRVGINLEERHFFVVYTHIGTREEQEYVLSDPMPPAFTGLESRPRFDDVTQGMTGAPPEPEGRRGTVDEMDAEALEKAREALEKVKDSKKYKKDMKDKKNTPLTEEDQKRMDDLKKAIDAKAKAKEGS